MTKSPAVHRDDILNGLNQAQLKAATHEAGPALVLAGAGTGKTKVITARIAHLIQTERALSEQILALTFTDKAAGEMEERVDQLLPYGHIDTQIMTFHALGSSLLQEFALEAGLATQTRLATPLQQHALMRTTLESLSSLKILRPAHHPHQYISQLLQYFSRLKDESINVVEFTKFVNKISKDSGLDFIDPAQYVEMAQVYAAYEEAKTRAGFIDFGDQLMLTYELLDSVEHVRKIVQSRYRYILVDEFQDTNTVQAKLLYRLVDPETKNLMVVGDDDQAIYRFRGAELQNIIDFQNQFPDVQIIVLVENYRSTQQIIDLSYSLIQHNNPQRLEAKLGIDKHLHAQGRGAEPEVRVLPDMPQELRAVVEQVKYHLEQGLTVQDIAVLARNNKQVGLVTRALEQQGVAVGTQPTARLLHRPVVRQAIDFLRVLHDPDDSAALYRYLMAPKLDLAANEVMGLSASARREHQSLAAYIELNRTDIPNSILNQFTALEGYRHLSKDFSTGEILYKFVTSDAYLDSLVERSQTDPQAGRDVQDLARFFRLIGELEVLDGLRDTEAVWSYIQDMYELAILAEPDETESREGVQVLTIHRSKGLEFEAVCIFDMTEGTFPSRRQSELMYLPQQIINYEPKILTQEHVQEERRLCYVGFTRAKQWLTIFYSRDHGGKRVAKPSRFLLEAFTHDNHEVQQLVTGHPIAIENFAPTRMQPTLLSYPESDDGWLTLSPNQLADYQADPYRFYVHNVLQFPQPATHQLVYGTAIHGALQHFFEEQLAGRLANIDDILTVFRRLWRNQGFASERHQQERLESGEAVLRRLWEEFKHERLPVVAVEEPFDIKFENLKLRVRGRVDLLLKNDNGLEIRDFKTSAVASQRRADERVRDNLALFIYALAIQRLREEPVETISLQFVNTGITAKRSKIDNENTINKLSKIVAGIRSNQFPKQGYFTNLEIEDL